MTPSRSLMSFALPRWLTPSAEAAAQPRDPVGLARMTETRDMRPRPGSPLWTYLTGVIVAGLVAIAVAQTRLGLGELTQAAREPLPWILLAFAVLGELRPVMVTSAPQTGRVPTASMFTFAALMYYGLPMTVLLHTAAVFISGLVHRQSWQQVMFAVAQATLAGTAASVVFGAFGIHPSPGAPWTPDGGDIPMIVLAGAAYFTVRTLLEFVAVALHERRPFTRVLRTSLGPQVLGHGTLLGLAPLVAVVMAHSAALVPLFVMPLAAVYLTASLSIRRDHQATHDGLTGLPNRKMLILRTEEALAAARDGERVGLLLLDLDRFKEVNDTLGHPVGDRLLQIIAYRLTHSVRPGDMVARLGGDEFAVLLPSIRDAQAAKEVASRLRVALSEPVRLEGMTFDLDASIGIALYPDHAPDFELLLQRSDVAMYLAKENRTGVEFYVPGKDRNSPERLSLLGDLRRAIDAGELELHYQPKVNLADGRVEGMEALVRWSHPERGPISPADFVPLAEQSYLMRELTHIVLRRALDQAARWWRDGLEVPVSVNVSARDLLDTGLPEQLEAGLAELGLPARAIQLEVTERILMTEQAFTAETIGTLARLGVELALDDFGTGYSSLVRLQRLPVSEVKIDRSFIRRIAESREDERIVRSIVDLVRSLGLRSVAEGVESHEIAVRLRKLGCQAGQGWWLAEPMAADEATVWLRARLSSAFLDRPRDGARLASP